MENSASLKPTTYNTAIRICQKHTRTSDVILRVLIYFAAILSVALLIGIVGYIVYRGVGAVDWTFLSTTPSVRKGTDGILGNIVNTLYLIVITLLIATPVGIGSAIYLNEYAKPGKLVNLIKFTTETLAGIPSIIFGMFGMMFFGTTLHLGYSILTGAFTLTLMTLPLITRNTQEALKTVPDSYRHGAVGIGATKWYMIRTILLPSAMPGIITGVILAIGRIVGESAALLFTAGSSDALPKTLEQAGTKIFSSGGSMTIRLYLDMSNGEYDSAFGTALVLLVIVFGINLIAKLIGRKFDVSKKK